MHALPLPPAWPASGPGDLAAEVEATVDAPEAPPAPGDVPGVQAREGHAHGLRYYEVVLGDVDFDAPLPLVMMIHGRGDRPRVPGGPFAGVPTPLRIILPEGPDPLGAGFMWLPVRVGEGKTDVLSEALVARAAQLAALLDEVRATRPTIGTPIVTGFSQGGLLSFAMAIRHPDVVGAAMPLAGWLPPPLWPERIDDAHRALRIRSMHGTADRIIPIEPTIEAVAHLERLGFDVQLERFEGVGHEVTPDMNALFEAWLEAALAERAGALDGGPGEPGPEVPDDAVPWEEQPADGEERLGPDGADGEDDHGSSSQTLPSAGSYTAP